MLEFEKGTTVVDAFDRYDVANSVKVISSEVVFRRAITLANCLQDVTLETVLSRPVGPVPASMFHDDSTMRKCVKADLAHGLEDGVNPLVELKNTNKDKVSLSAMQCLLFKQHK